MNILDIMYDALKRASLLEYQCFLTLRYYPQDTSILPPNLEWMDFLEYEGSEKYIQTLLEGSIKRIFAKYDPKNVGMGISGGVDSTTILSLTRKVFPDIEIKTFCISFGEDEGEEKDASTVSEIYDTDHENIRIENPFTDLKKQIEIVDEPRWNLYSYYLFQEAKRKGCDLILSGDGGDELFGGYVFRYNSVLNSKTDPFVKRYLEAHNRDWVPDQEDLFETIFDWDDIYSLIDMNFDNPLSNLGKIFLADYNGKLLYDFTPTNKKFSRHFKINYVAPMLEPEVLHVATHIPYRFKYDPLNGVGKIVLRQILLENFGYKPSLKGKVGWGMDIRELWDKHVKDLCMDMSRARFVEIGLINESWLQKGLIKANDHDLRYINKMLGLLALETWLNLQG